MCLLIAACGAKRPAVQPKAPKHPTIPAAMASAIVREAHRWIGTPYKYGKQTRRKGTDCSGMVMTIFLDKGNVELPRNSAMQYTACIPLDISELRPADLIFFSSKAGGSRISHIGIYIGDGEFIHASSSRGVMVSRLSEPYFRRHYYGGGRPRSLATGRVNAPAPAPVVAPMPEEMPAMLSAAPVLSDIQPETVTVTSGNYDILIDPHKTDSISQADSIAAEVRNAFN